MNDTIPGNLHVANDVLADMVGNAALECYGVVGMAAPSAADGIAKILPASRLRRGVTVGHGEECLAQGVVGRVGEGAGETRVPAVVGADFRHLAVA